MVQRGSMTVLALALLVAGACAGGLIETVDLVESADTSSAAGDGGLALTVALNNDTALPAGGQVVVDFQVLFSDAVTPGHPPAPVAPAMPHQRRAPLVQSDPDGEPSVWRGVIPTRNMSQGALLQYRALVLANDGSVLDATPAGLGAGNSTSMYTWVVGFDAINASSPVPALMWYTHDPERSRWDYPTPGSIAFDSGDAKLRYYSTVTVHREGSGRKDGNLKAKDWPKRKLRVTFLSEQHFRWPGGDGYKVKRLNLRSMYVESGSVSYMREALALQLFKQAGVPCADAFYVRLYLNGNFYGLYLAVEDIDKRWLARRSFPNTTLLLKSEHYKYSNLRAPDSRLDCPQTAPDQDYPGKGRGKGRDCPMIYQVVHPPLPGGPWDRRWDGVVNNFTTSLQEVVNRVSWAGINDSFVKGFWQLRVNVGEVVNEMAVQTLILNIDRCSKNHYIHRTPDGRFGLIPYDVEDAFATDWRSNHAARSCSAQGWSCRDSGCLLSCGDFNSIYMCDRIHPQDPQDRTTYNHLYDGILGTPPLRERYLQRLRQLADTYSSSGLIEREIRDTAAYIAADARADMRLWSIAGNYDDNVAALISQVQTRRGQLYDQLDRARG